ncbi:MAG TPA: cupin domain-containing protein [Terriglobia bacterium]|nr:cupin domain-containing protein [Terriglobia bacterium]
MSKDTGHDLSHRRPHSPPTAGPFLEYDLTKEVHELHEEPSWKNGQNTKTLVKYDNLRVLLTALKAKVRISEHKTEGRISVQIISGHLRMTASGRTFDLRPGSLLALDSGILHDVEALEDSAFLLTIAWPGRDGSAR